MANRIDLSNILINFLKKARYERHIEEGTLEENQFYAVTDGNEKTEYGDLFGNIENQADLYNALYASRLFKMEMCNDPRGYELVHKLYDRREFDLSKFTVVGNPVISEDGVASGFSNSFTSYVSVNGLKAKDLKDKSWKIKASVIVPNGFQKIVPIFNIGKVYGMFGAAIVEQGRVRFASRTGTMSDTNNEGRKITINKRVDATHIAVELEYKLNTGTYKLIAYDFLNNIKLGEGSWTAPIEGRTNTQLVGINEGGEIVLGAVRDSNTWYEITHIIDLKDFSITVDGEEVFNGIKDFKRYDTYTLPSSEVITIPYIPSVDGVKIVDVAYKPLVDQLYTETGMGNYIIIDETNKTFRLPLPDIYSQIENKTSFTLRKWED